MEAIVKSMYKIHKKNSNKINFGLFKGCEYRKFFNEKDDPECAICYKRIYDKVFVCAKPCAKTFHLACMKKMVDQIEENADEENADEDEQKPICYQCCYCRREFDIANYDMSLFIQELEYSRGCGYQVDHAILQVYFNAMMDDETCEYQYDVAIPVDLTFIKTPKVAKRAEFKNKGNTKNTKKRGQQRGQQCLYKGKGRR